MELKISKIQWKKVLAFALTLCMTISMVQLPVNAEETTEPNTTKYFCVSDLESYKQTATFFDAAADGSRDAIDVTPMEEEDKAYTVDPTKGYYDAKWFSFTPSEDGTYSFKGEKIENNEVDSYGALMEKDGEEYRYITKNDDGAGNRQFEIKSTLQKGKTYYLCAGYFNKGEVKYNVKVSKMKIKELAENESDTFSAEDTPKYYTFIPTESGYYNLKLSWDSDKSLYDRSYVVEDQNGEKVYDIDSSWNQSGYTAKYLFEQGKTYYFNMKYFMLTDVDDDEEVVSGNITISISKIPVEEIRENQPGSFKTGTDSTRFKITVNDTGWYYLKYSWDGEKDSANISNDFDIRNESNRRWEYLTATYGTSYFIYLEKEKTYFLNQDGYTVTYDDETEAPESVDISISKAEYSNINTSQNGIISSGKGEKLFIFTPDKTGYYNLEATWDKEKLPEAVLSGDYRLYETYEDEGDFEVDQVTGRSLSSAYKFQAKKGQTYYLTVSGAELGVWEDEGYCAKDGDISISISDLESAVDTITSEKAGEYVSNLYNGNDSKVFKYTAGEDGYYKLSFDWNKKLTEKMSVDSHIRVKDEDASYISSIYGVDESKNLFMKKGETYYIEVSYIELYMNEGEEWPSENVQVAFKINMSQLPINQVDYGKSENIKTNSDSKIFKFTAQQDGYHVLICKWNNTDNQMVAWGSIADSDNYSVSNSKIAKENNAYYRRFKCEKGKTYYINLTNMAFKSVSTKEDVDNVDVEVSVAYYNGKTDLDTIKNTQPWTPDQNNGNNDKPNNGNTDNGNTNKPSTPEQKPSNNTTVKPATIKVSKIKIAATSNKIAAGKKVKLTATVTPANASNKSVKWTTSNKKVAVVSKNGVVTVNKNAGGKTVVITAIAADGKGARATYKITVMKDAVKKVTITGKNVVKAGKKLTLKAKVAAGKKANKKLVWSTSNKKFATVNQKGVVTAKKAGKGKKVKITAKATDGSNKKKVFTIKIK